MMRIVFTGRDVLRRVRAITLSAIVAVICCSVFAGGTPPYSVKVPQEDANYNDIVGYVVERNSVRDNTGTIGGQKQEGKIIGRVNEHNPILDGNGNALARYDSNGNLNTAKVPQEDANDKGDIVGYVVEPNSVRDNTGTIGGRKQEGKIIGRVNERKPILDGDGNVLARYDSKGNPKVDQDALSRIIRKKSFEQLNDVEKAVISFAAKAGVRDAQDAVDKDGYEKVRKMDFLSAEHPADVKDVSASIDTSKLEALIKEQIALLKNMLSKSKDDAKADIRIYNENAEKVKDAFVAIVSQINATYPSTEERGKASNAIFARVESSLEEKERLRKEVEARGIGRFVESPFSADQQAVIKEWEKK